jgi:hypothetical protein
MVNSDRTRDIIYTRQALKQRCQHLETDAQRSLGT